MRFVHIADVHLDTPFRAWSADLRRRLREASRTAFRRAVDLALAERVEALLIAGDLFDGERLSFETERFLGDELSRLGEANIDVFYAAGNHDPGQEDTRRGHLPWPPHVHRFMGSPRTVTVTDDSGRALGTVTGAGHEGRRVTEDLSGRFERPPPGAPSVALLHTQVRTSSTSELHGPYAPSDLGRLRSAGFDYWALGHVHSRQCLSEDPPIHYPGNTHGRTPRETGAKGGLLVDLTPDGTAQVSFHPLSPIRWEDLELSELSEIADLRGLVASARDEWDALRAEDPGEPGTEWIVQVKLAGSCPLWALLRKEDELEALTDELRGALGAASVRVWTDSVHRPLDPADYERRPDVLGEALAVLKEILDGSRLPGVTAEDLAGFDAQRDGSPETYVRALLEGADAEIVSRLLRRAERAP